MTKRTVALKAEPGGVEVRYRPLYARLLGLRHLHPGGMLCFVYLEGAVALSLLLALAELVSWWVVLILPVSVAVMVKVNDWVAGAVARSAARTPDRERERLRREVSAFMPVVGRAAVVTPAQRGGPHAGSAESDNSTPSTTDQAHASSGRAADKPHASGSGVDQAQAGSVRGVDQAHVSIGAVADEAHTSAGAGDRHASSGRGVDQAHVSIGAGADEAHASMGEGHVSAGQGDDDRHTSIGAGVGEAQTTGGHDSGDRHADAAAAGRWDTAGRYAAAGRYLDAAWRQHAYAMTHQADHADPTSQRERQSASRRYE